MSLEFLEHVSADRSDILVDFICSKGDALLISAAIPLQGGEHHVNEQWPEYWIDKFRARGFVPFDALRLALWDNAHIDSWYRQNFMLFFREVPAKVKAWGADVAMAALYAPTARVHPEFYAKRLGRIDYLLTNPLGFIKMIRDERKSGRVGLPPIKNLSNRLP